MNGRRFALCAGVSVGAVTLRRMQHEVDRDGRLSPVTAAVLDVLCVAHLGGVWWEGHHDEGTRLPAIETRATGRLLAAGGLSVMIAGMRRFASISALNAVEGMDELITGGAYRWTRNPQYLGWTLLLAGVALGHGSPRALALALLYPAGVRLWLPHEEAALERRFGATYRAYRSRVGRWLGRREGAR